MTKGKLIVLEGIDGSGKKTQTKLLVERLSADGVAVRTLDFPRYTDNFFGAVVRRYLDGEFGSATAVDPHLASLLYAADRWESAAQLRTWLDDGCTIVLDRYASSNLIHQAIKVSAGRRPAFISWIQRMEFEIFKIPMPTLTLFLHVPAEIAFSLIGKRGAQRDGHERDRDFLSASEAQCVTLAKQFAWRTIECAAHGAMRPQEDIAREIYQALQ